MNKEEHNEERDLLKKQLPSYFVKVAIITNPRLIDLMLVKSKNQYNRDKTDPMIAFLYRLYCSYTHTLYYLASLGEKVTCGTVIRLMLKITFDDYRPKLNIADTNERDIFEKAETIFDKFPVVDLSVEQWMESAKFIFEETLTWTQLGVETPELKTVFDFQSDVFNEIALEIKEILKTKK